MSAEEVRLELLLGCEVRDADGASAGKIQEILVEERDDEWVVTNYLTGPAGMLARLSSLDIGLWVLGLLGAGKSPGGLRIPWNELDLADPAHPRLLCRVDELQEADPQPDAKA
ncbi:MAG TPA: PRC-barrel domain-containing protein [Longimicrobiaceae bacterium]|nr:PRC-barrel domain-containing protein [Longimicrobiaceae bacterium]